MDGAASAGVGALDRLVERRALALDAPAQGRERGGRRLASSTDVVQRRARLLERALHVAAICAVRHSAIVAEP
ncbi:MAG TPA: hypothetical protein DEF51_17420 [Myxococcales bacterium]|nr:hypothetical protein [Myxococcales bacterium]